MLHVTKKCWRPFRHWQRQTWEEGVRNSRWAKAFLKVAGLFWLLYHKKKSFVSWNKWILELGTSNFHQPLSGNCQQHRRGRFISSLDSQRDRWCMSQWVPLWLLQIFNLLLIYYQIPCLKSTYTYVSLTIKLTWFGKQKEENREVHKLLL